MSALALVLTVILVAIALLHVLWGIGFWWPIRDERALARAVVGTPGIERMPGAVACSLVAVAILACAALLTWPDGLVRTIGLPAVAAVFIGRGIAAHVPAWRRLAPEEPFATLDRRFYGPLCLLIGAGFLAVAAGLA